MKNNLKIFALTVFCFNIAAAGIIADTGNKGKIKYVPDTFVILPAKTKMIFEWLLPPRDRNGLKPAAENNAQFSVDTKGNLWFGRDNNMLANFGKNFVLKMDVPYREFVFLDSGVMYISTDKYLGFIAEIGKKAEADKNGIISASFQPLASLPVPGCSMFPGEGNILYLKGYDNESGDSNVYTFGGKGSTVKTGDKGSALCYKHIFSVKKPITAVAGNGKKTYIAMGRMIVEITNGKDGVKGFFVHPSEDITGIAYSGKAGIFYSTASYIGYAEGNGCIDFMKASNPRILMQKNILYVFMPDNYGVLKISNVDDLKNYNFHSKKKSGAEK